MNPRLYVDCEKHGRHWALPIIDGAYRPHANWPCNVETLPRTCARCLAEVMVQPIRRAQDVPYAGLSEA